MTDITAMLKAAKDKSNADRWRRANVSRELEALSRDLKGTNNFHVEPRYEGDDYVIQFVNRSNGNNSPDYMRGVVLTLVASGIGFNQITVRGRTHTVASAFIPDNRDRLTEGEISHLRGGAQRAMSDAKFPSSARVTRQPS